MIVSLYVAMSIFGKTFLTKKFDSVCYLGDIYIYIAVIDCSESNL